jgi:integrase
MIKGGLQKRGNTWYAVYRQNGKQVWKSTGATRESVAKERLQDIIAPLNATDQARALREAADTAYELKGQLVGRSLRIAEIWDKFQKSPERLDAASSTMEMYKGQLDRFIRWITLHRPKYKAMADVTDQVARDYAENLSTATGSPTYNKHITLLSMVWKIVGRAIGWKENPWTAIAKKRSVSVSRRDLTVEEIRKLITAATGEWKDLIVIGLYTALRLADAATLRWNEVDLDQRKIVRAPRKTVRRTGKSVSVPIFQDLAEVLRRRRAEVPDGETYVLPEIARLYDKDPTRVSKLISRIFDAAEIQRTTDETAPGRMRPSVSAGFHSLRHTFVSLCSTANIPVAVVQSIVGHGNPAMTRHYTHIGDEAAKSAVATLPNLDGSQTSPRPQPLPEWARKDLQTMTERNWQEVRASMLADQATQAKPIQNTLEERPRLKKAGRK